jgi:hypothetical protein
MVNEHPTMEEDIQSRVAADEEITKLQRVKENILKTALDDDTKWRWIRRIDAEIAKRL